MGGNHRRPIIIGNWKMNKTTAEAVDLVTRVRNALGGVNRDIEVGVAPPYTALPAVARRVADSRVLLCAQNCHQAESGAFTGEVSVPMLADVGCSHVIVGHSERRQYFAEGDALVGEKARAVLAGGLTPVICLGERLEQREAGETFAVVDRQLDGAIAGMSGDDVARVVIAYEPVWAIGTGRTATTVQAQEVHAHLRSLLSTRCGRDVAEAVRIQYGGSVKPDNVAGLMAQPDIDGALVGGASLKADSFISILRYDR